MTFVAFAAVFILGWFARGLMAVVEMNNERRRWRAQFARQREFYEQFEDATWNVTH